MAKIEEKLSDMHIEDDINILLLGETGVGKSTFINSFINYLQFDNLKAAHRNIEHIQCIIPSRFTVCDENLDEKIVEFGSSENENTSEESATLETKSYVFNLPKYDRKLRIVDTPGIGDTHGINQDIANIDNIVNYLSSIKYLNGICIFLKPNQTRCTIMFQYCMYQLLSCLHITAIDNIIFIFTSTSQSFFKPGETIHSLSKVLKDIEDNEKHTIPLTKENIYCVDNEAFRYLLARKTGISLGKEEIFHTSWTHAHGEYWRMVDYIIGKTPYNVENTLYLYRIRKKFEDLTYALTYTMDLLKNEKDLSKKFESTVTAGDTPEVIEDAENNVEIIKNRMSTSTEEHCNIIMQITKLVTFLQTNSIVIYNEYCGGYIRYLINCENSAGSAANRRLIQKYNDLIQHYDRITDIMRMDVHFDPFSPVMTRAELSLIFPSLETEMKSFNSTKAQCEVIVDINKNLCDADNSARKNYETANVKRNYGNSALGNEQNIDSGTITVENDYSDDEGAEAMGNNQNIDVTLEAEAEGIESENNSSLFDDFFKAVMKTSLVLDRVEKSVNYEELRKQYVKEEHSNVNTKFNFNDIHPNQNSSKLHHKVPFKKHPKNLNTLHVNNEPPPLWTNFPSTSTNVHTPPRAAPNKRNKYSRGNTVHNQSEQRNRSEGKYNRNFKHTRGKASSSCFLDDMDTSSARTKQVDDFVHVSNSDEFVFVDNPQQNKHRGGFRGRSRGRARGTNQQSNRGSTSKNNSSYNHPHNKQQHNKAKSPKGSDNKDAQTPKNLLASIKNIFD